MVTVNVDNLSAVPESKHYLLPEEGMPIAVRVHTYYSLYPRYSVWDPRVQDWWRDIKDARRAWSTIENAEKAIVIRLTEEENGE